MSQALEKMELEAILDSREAVGSIQGEALVSIAISQKRLADAAEMQAIALKRLADHFCKPLAEDDDLSGKEGLRG